MTDETPTIIPGQLTMLEEERAHARRSDPATSHAAAASVDRIRESQAAILRVFGIVGPMHDQRLVAAYQAARIQPVQSESGIRTRRRELVDKGRLRDTGETMILPSGRRSIIWELAS